MGHRLQQPVSVVTSCNIPSAQNEERQIHRLGAASRIYGRAKVLMAVQFTLTVPAALVSSILMAWQPTWKIWLTFISITIALTDALCITRALSKLKKRGAVIQQMFDCDMFQLPWNSLRCGSRPDTGEVKVDGVEHIQSTKSQDRLLNWYPPEVGKLPLWLARIVCQRASFCWDLGQRDRVRGGLTGLLGLLAILVFLIALLRGDSVQQMILTVYVPLAPAVLWILREIIAQRDAIHAVERGLAATESTWKQALEGTIGESEASRQSILFQDALFENRSRSPLVFNWIYLIIRKRKEAEMRATAADMVTEAVARLGLQLSSMK